MSIRQLGWKDSIVWQLWFSPICSTQSLSLDAESFASVDSFSNGDRWKRWEVHSYVTVYFLVFPAKCIERFKSQIRVQLLPSYNQTICAYCLPLCAVCFLVYPCLWRRWSSTYITEEITDEYSFSTLRLSVQLCKYSALKICSLTMRSIYRWCKIYWLTEGKWIPLAVKWPPINGNPHPSTSSGKGNGVALEQGFVPSGWWTNFDVEGCPHLGFLSGSSPVTSWFSMTLTFLSACGKGIITSIPIGSECWHARYGEMDWVKSDR